MLNPFKVLGTHRDATDTEIRSAYLQATKKYPADLYAKEFQRIQQAYSLIKDAKARVRFELLDYKDCSKQDMAELLPSIDYQQPSLEQLFAYLDYREEA